MAERNNQGKSQRRLSQKQLAQRTELAEQIMRQRRNQSSKISKQTKEARQLGLKVQRRETIKKKDLLAMPVKELRKLAKQTAKKPENSTVLMKNKHGVLLSLAQVDRYFDSLKEYDKKVTQPMMRKMKPKMAKAANIDLGKPQQAAFMELVMAGSDLEGRKNRAQSIRSARELAEDTAKLQKEAQEGDSAKYELYKHNYLKSFRNCFTDADPMLTASVQATISNMDAEDLVGLYYQYGGIFSIGYLYSRWRQNEKLNQMVSKLNQYGFNVGKPLSKRQH